MTKKPITPTQAAAALGSIRTERKAAAARKNGKQNALQVRAERIGFSVNVWFGGLNGLRTDKRRYVYATREQAKRADISDEIGKNGRIA